jgi:DNA polymerase III delta prime subunit
VRDGFDNYKAATLRQIKDDNNFKKVNAARMRHQHQTKKRTFYAIQGFASNFVRARIFIRNLISRQGRAQKKMALGYWRSFVERHIDAKLKQR